MKKKTIFQTLLIMIILSINAMATIAPKAPINAGAYKFTENSTRLSFMDMSDNEEGFRVYHNGDIIGTVGAKDGNGTYQYITLRDLKKATLYTVNIVAYNNAGESTPLIKSFRTISIPKSNVPAQPGAYIGVWNETEDSVRISFMDNSDNEDGFRVEDLDGNVLMDNIPPKDLNGTYQHITLSGLDEGKLYFIRVFAYNESGVSIPSSTRAFRTKCSNKSSRVKKTGQSISYYPKDDGDYQKGLTLSYVRDNIKEIVTDNITRLQWQDNEDAKTIIKNNYEASNYCSKLTLGGYNDWRLPTRKELFGILDFSRVHPSIDTNKFKNINSDFYWTSTTHEYSVGSNTWVVDFDNIRSASPGELRTSKHNVRCVRVVSNL